jgi:hypothetical protein
MISLVRRRFDQARLLFVAALHFAPDKHHGSSARMVAACCHASGRHDDALAYLNLAEQPIESG